MMLSFVAFANKPFFFPRLNCTILCFSLISNYIPNYTKYDRLRLSSVDGHHLFIRHLVFFSMFQRCLHVPTALYASTYTRQHISCNQMLPNRSPLLEYRLLERSIYVLLTIITPADPPSRYFALHRQIFIKCFSNELTVTMRRDGGW